MKKWKPKKLQPRQKLLKLSNLQKQMRVTQAQLKKMRKSLNQKQRLPQSKYGNKKTVYNGRLYDSKKEAGRAQELDILVRVGEVISWSPQPVFRIEHRGVNICKYIADFMVEYADGRIEYEDVKGFRTAIYRLKKKLVKAFYSVDIKEI